MPFRSGWRFFGPKAEDIEKADRVRRRGVHLARELGDDPRARRTLKVAGAVPCAAARPLPAPAHVVEQGRG